MDFVQQVVKHEMPKLPEDAPVERPETTLLKPPKKAPPKRPGQASSEDQLPYSAPWPFQGQPGGAPDWQAPPARRAPKAPPVIAPAESRQQSRWNSGVSEQEIVSILKVIAGSSPEARDLLTDVRKQIDEMRRFERLRRF